MKRLFELLRLDIKASHRQPSVVRLVVATVIALGGSLAADAILVAIGTAVFSTTRGYVHFAFSDYGKLTVIGVMIACLGWPVITRITSSPRWLFLRLAVLVTVVLWAPDLWILDRGAPPKAVAVLMVMHLAIAFVTYNALVRIAKPLSVEPQSRPNPNRLNDWRIEFALEKDDLFDRGLGIEQKDEAERVRNHPLG
jgi:hypothetical protein